MEQWEYRLVVLSPVGDGRMLGTGGILFNWVVTYTVQSDGAAIKTDANSYIAYLGQNGWELMSTHPVPVVTAVASAAPGLALMFRRPKAA